MIKEQKVQEINPLIKEAINNDLYGLNAEDFFVKKILTPIQQSRKSKRIENKSADRDLLKSYFINLSETLIPTESLVKQLEFLSEGRNSDLASEFSNYIHKIFSTKFLLWTINNSSEKLSKILSVAMTKRLNNNQYPIEEIIDNLTILKNEEKKELFLSEIFLTKNINHYVALNKATQLTDKQRHKIIEKILIKNNESILLNRDKIKELIIESINHKRWNIFDTYIRNLSVNKIDYIIDILVESKNESTEKNKNNYDIGIYKVIDKAIYLRQEELIERVIELKKEQPKLTDFDIYLLMAKRIYSYMKKEQSQDYFRKIVEVAKANNEFEKLKNILFSSTPKYHISNLDLEVNLQDPYFNREMKLYFMTYLDEKLKPKNIYHKPNKI